MNKPSKSNNITKRINEITEAWTKHATEAKFAGLTLMEFQAAINPPLAIRANMNEARRDIKGKIAQKKTADIAARDLLRRVVDCVIADPNYGPNSALYRAMDYVTRDERKSGLTRKYSAATGGATSGSTETATAVAAASTPTTAPAKA